MASVISSPICDPASVIQSTSAHSALEGIRKRRTPSEEAAALEDNHRQNGVYDNGDSHFVDVDISRPNQQQTDREFLTNTAGTTTTTTTEGSNGSKSIFARFWSRWKWKDTMGNRLAGIINWVQSSIIFRWPITSIKCSSVWRRRRVAAQCRTVIPNHSLPPSSSRQQKHPNRRYAGNKIKTTKYTVLTFLPKNLFEQFHRFANLYFVFIVLLNWIPEIEAFGKELSMIPVLFVLAVTAVKDIFEDRRRYLSDWKVNHATCRVFHIREGRYVRTQWKDVIVGDFVHLSCNEIIPADILLVRSSDPLGICYVETSNLDGESNLKQRHVVASLLDKQGHSFSPMDFKSTIECEQPNNQIYKFNGFLLHQDGQREVINKNNLLLRGCEVRNTDFIEGIVIYAGRETKAMLNNSGPRYKRSKLERLMNWDIVWCVVILLVMCFVGALGGGIWLSSFDNPYVVPFLAHIQNKGTMNPELEGFLVFWTYIIVLQVMIPVSLYVSIEIVKLGQIFFITQDPNLYYSPTKKRIQCRALNIPEELGQIEYVMSDKTGTLTENQMIFRRCAIAGVDYASSDLASGKEQTDYTSSQMTKETCKDTKINPHLQQIMIASCYDQSTDDRPFGGDNSKMQTFFDFFINMAICNTIVVNPHPHSDRMNASGYIHDDSSSVTCVHDATAVSNNTANGLLMRATIPAASPKIVGQTPVDFPSPRYMERRPSKGPQHVQAPAIITTMGHAGDNEEEDGDEDKQRTSKDGPEGDTADASTAKSTRPGNLNLGKMLLQLPALAKGRLPPMGLKKTPVETPSVSPGYRNPVYEAESPDELALVYASAAYSFRLVKRQLNSITVELPNAELLKYEILHILPFDSVRKRMSVIVRQPKNKKIVLFCKGADTAVMDVLSNEFCKSQRGQLYVYKSQEYLNLYASYGLRTLCLAKRELEPEEYARWAANHEDAELSLDDDREQLIFESAVSIEKDLELLGVSGIEDRLQDGVPECLAALRQAGIKVWVLTGDKIETAVNIAYACKLFVYGMELIQLCTRTEEDADTLLQHHLDQLATRRNAEPSSSQGQAAGIALVVDGQTLAFCLTPKLEGKFVQLIAKCTSVLCCRTTPLQKASIVRLVKEKLEIMTLAIGDGANDTSMIQCADVGVGLSGQEGMQAVMASDFALPQFRFLQRLLLVHGHWCYDRLARMVLYFFFKNAMFVFTLFWYQFFNGFTAQVMIDPIYLILHNLLFTSAPPLLLGVLDQDASSGMLYQQHSLYSQGPKSLLYRSHSFWLNILDALWQSAVCYFFAHFMCQDAIAHLWSFGFLIESALVACNHFHLLLICRAWTWPIIVSVFGSFIIFYGFALAYNALAGVVACAKDCPYWVAERMVADVNYWLALLLIVVTALIPRFMCQSLMNTLLPSDVLKARLCERHKRKLKSGKSVPWIVKFANKTKSVSFVRPSMRSAANATGNIANQSQMDREREPVSADTAQEMRV